MANRFEQAKATYENANTSEFEKGRALAVMQEENRKRDEYNKENNPKKYHEDRAKQAHQKAEFHETEAKKHPAIIKPVKHK